MNSIDKKNIKRWCIDRLSDLYTRIVCEDIDAMVQQEAFHDDNRESARNLLHYMELRRHDIRELQIDLRQLGVSSLGRLESHVQAGLAAALSALGADMPKNETAAPLLSIEEGEARLAHHTAQLLGPLFEDRSVRIMVTLPTDAAFDRDLVYDLVKAGMDVARINCAHDSPEEWRAMATLVREASVILGRNCKILMDLPGPKLRTGTMTAGPRVRKFKPVRDQRGVVVQPASIILCTNEHPGFPAEETLPVDAEIIDIAEIGDELTFRDARGKRRVLHVTDTSEHRILARTDNTCYAETGLKIRLQRDGKTLAKGVIGELPCLDTWITLHEGDLLILTASPEAGRPAVYGQHEDVLKPAHIPCTLPQIFKDVEPGHPVHFDDGKISGIVEHASTDALHIRILLASEKGSKLRADKGINFPETVLNVPALSSQDLSYLDLAVELADMVGLSFVRDPADVILLQNELEKRTDRNLGVILKIETRRGFEQLPGLLLAGLKRLPLGVMVARGDLGVEVGFERMAEVQEEILWLCEAAHVPVIWATQVLEQMNKRGFATRGEITDAAMSSRAECVMLNKGPHIVETVYFLKDIILRMQDHHSKKTPMLRRLKVSEGRWRDFSYLHAS